MLDFDSFTKLCFKIFNLFFVQKNNTHISTSKNGSGDKSSSPPFELSFGGDELWVISDARSLVCLVRISSDITKILFPSNESSNGGDELLSPLPFFKVDTRVLR